MDPPRWPADLRRYVVIAVAFGVQILAYAALVALTTHDGAMPLVSALQQVPTLLLVLLGIAAVPAVAVTIGVGQALEYAFGVRVVQFDAILVTQGDGLFFVIAALLSIAVVTLGRQARRKTG
ncbi:hypothetical protein NDI54_04000 [Haloarcula sp. S1AR25-5A]|uniref:Uncharacterized protein n=1 Tax=Haloarcula terrestris TaxID=2950533 RepID=A0AAE4EUS1_9EURY|nr:hypothetical protein [Haloarcula terrestris]MDS0220511.1 hypothetical protein [Haloarcula terrestris]